MHSGYARILTQHLHVAAQIAALKDSGCELIFQEKASRGRRDRLELHRLLGGLRKGDVVVIWKLNRLSRSIKSVLTLMKKSAQAGAWFRDLTEVIETTSPGCQRTMQFAGIFAEFERVRLRERIRKELDAARKEGCVGGRRPKLYAHQQEKIVHSVNSGRKTAEDVARLFNIHPSVVSRLLHRSKRT